MAITKYKVQTKTYKALLTQTGEYSVTTISEMNWAFIIGETYTITDYATGDDFSNIANVVSGVINTTGCVFIATGKRPTDWGNGSTITSNGGLVVNELENNLGFPVEWGQIGEGSYMAYNADLGPTDRSFPSEKTQIFVQNGVPFYPAPLLTLSGVGNFGGFIGMPDELMSLDNILFIVMIDFSNGNSVDNALMYLPVSIEIKD